MIRLHRWSIWCFQSQMEGWTSLRPWLGRRTCNHTVRSTIVGTTEYFEQCIVRTHRSCWSIGWCKLGCIHKLELSLSVTPSIWWPWRRSSWCFFEQTGSRPSRKRWRASRHSKRLSWISIRFRVPTFFGEQESRSCTLVYIETGLCIASICHGSMLEERRMGWLALVQQTSNSRMRSCCIFYPW